MEEEGPIKEEVESTSRITRREVQEEEKRRRRRGEEEEKKDKAGFGPIYLKIIKCCNNASSSRCLSLVIDQNTKGTTSKSTFESSFNIKARKLTFYI